MASATNRAVTPYSPSFGYGSNIGTEQMNERCPGNRYGGLARLDGWYDSANVRPLTRITDAHK